MKTMLMTDPETAIRRIMGSPIVYPSEFLPDDGNVIFANNEHCYAIFAPIEAAKKLEAQGFTIRWPKNAEG